MSNIETYTGITIHHLEPTSESERGVMWEAFKSPSEQRNVFYANPGMEFGNHFHKMNHPFKNPERNFIAFGRGKFVIKDWREKKIIELEKVVEQGDLVTIEAGVYHTLHSITSMVVLEDLEIKYNPEDTNTFKGIEAYAEYIESLRRGK